MQKVAIIGAGNFGQAIAHILAAKSDVQIALWDTDEAKVPDMQPLADVLTDAPVVFLCVSSWSLRRAAESLLPHLVHDAIVVCPTKGIEEKTLQTSDEVLRDVFQSNATVALLHGPMLAAEIREGLPAFSALATKSRDAYDTMKALFEGTLLQLEYSEDIHGIALAGVLKNIYSIGLGMADALALGSNFRGWFVHVAVKEMSHIISSSGGVAMTALSGAGLADMIATGFSPHSRNCQVGHEIVQSGECITVSEGAQSLPYMIQLLERNSIQAPLCVGISDIVSGKAHAPHIDKVVQSCLL